MNLEKKSRSERGSVWPVSAVRLAVAGSAAFKTDHRRLAPFTHAMIQTSNIEAPLDNVTVAHNIFFAFDAQLTSLAGFGFRS